MIYLIDFGLSKKYITKDNKHMCLCSEFTKMFNAFSEEKVSGQKIVKDMAFNGFEVHKNKGNKYYYGLVVKSGGEASLFHFMFLVLGKNN